MKGTNEHTNFSATVTCPYCGREQDECYPKLNGEWETEECESCEKKFITSAFVEYQSSRSCKENGLTCDLESDVGMNLFESKYIWFKCKNCLGTTASIREKSEIK